VDAILKTVVALVKSMREGQGPRGLRFKTGIFDQLPPFEYLERWISFLNALRGNTHLELLALSGVGVHEDAPQALTVALRENKGLNHLSLHSCNLDDHWSELMRSMSTHPMLRTLAIFARSVYSDDMQQERTKIVADMLLVDDQIEEICVDDHSFDWAAWDTLLSET
jgi:phosphoribosylanthranilate isomerase